MKEIVEFLETKRDKFPRLYFLSNDELVDLYGKNYQSDKSPETFNGPTTYIARVFEGIDRVTYNQNY